MGCGCRQPAGRGILSHETALGLLDLCDVNPDRIHISVPPTNYRPRKKGGDGYIVHIEQLDENEITWHEGIPIVTPGKAIEQAIKGAVPTHLIRQAIETASRLGRVPIPELDNLRELLKDRQ